MASFRELTGNLKFCDDVTTEIAKSGTLHIDIDNNRLILHDGVTPGGIVLGAGADGGSGGATGDFLPTTGGTLTGNLKLLVATSPRLLIQWAATNDYGRPSLAFASTYFSSAVGIWPSTSASQINFGPTDMTGTPGSYTEWMSINQNLLQLSNSVTLLTHGPTRFQGINDFYNTVTMAPGATLILGQDPVDPLEACTRQYTDAQIENASNTGLTGFYYYNARTNNTAETDPGKGNIEWNTATQSDASQLYIANISSANNDLIPVWRQSVGQQLLMQRQNDSTINVRYTITGIVEHGTWFTLNVTPISSAGLPFTGSANLIVVIGTKATGSGGDGGVGVQSATATVTSAQLLAIADTPAIIIPALGAGKIIIPLQVIYKLNFGTVPYTVSNTGYVSYRGVSNQMDDGSGYLLGDLQSGILISAAHGPSTVPMAYATDMPIGYSCPSPSPTDGDGTLDITVLYTVMTVPPLPPSVTINYPTDDVAGSDLVYPSGSVYPFDTPCEGTILVGGAPVGSWIPANVGGGSWYCEVDFSSYIGQAVRFRVRQTGDHSLTADSNTFSVTS